VNSRTDGIFHRAKQGGDYLSTSAIWPYLRKQSRLGRILNNDNRMSY